MYRISKSFWISTIAVLILFSGCNSGDLRDTNNSTTNTVPTSPDDSDSHDNSSFCEVNTLLRETAYSELTQGIGTAPIQQVFAEATAGTLNLGVNTNVVPIISSDKGVIAAASTLGQGRVLAYSSQDFISSQTRSTLLGDLRLDTLLINALIWAAGTDDLSSISVLTDSQALTDKLLQNSVNASTVNKLATNGLREFRTWDTESISAADVLVIQVNEWGTLHLDPKHVGAIRNHVTDGGGLIIAGSALHWSWWLSDSSTEFPANTILKDTGIEFNATSISSFTSSPLVFDSSNLPTAIWCDYIRGAPITNNNLLSLPGLFAARQKSGKAEDLSRAFARLVSETPPLPAHTGNANATIYADIAAQLAPLEWTEILPWAPKLRDGFQDAVSESTKIVLSGESTGYQPLGMYAPPGSIVTVTLPQSTVNNGYTIQVGEKLDDLRKAKPADHWERAPYVTRQFDIVAHTTKVINVFGGALYLHVPEVTASPIEITIKNALPMPVYTKNQTGVDDWVLQVASTYSPVVILQEPGRVRMVANTQAAADVAQPDQVIDFWSGFHRHHAELAQEPVARNYESHWVFDEQVGYGYANATKDRIVFPALALPWALRTQTGNEDWWLFGHELGHQFQTSDWTGGDITEVVGWDSMQTTFASYYDDAYPRDTYGSYMDGFAIRYSALNQVDISDFLQRWEYPVSSSAVDRIKSFNYPVWLPPGW